MNQKERVAYVDAVALIRRAATEPVQNRTPEASDEDEGHVLALIESALVQNRTDADLAGPERELAVELVGQQGADVVVALARLAEFYMTYYGEHVAHRDEIAFHAECAADGLANSGWDRP